MRFSLCFTLQKGHVAFDGLELCIYLKRGVNKLGLTWFIFCMFLILCSILKIDLVYVCLNVCI